jgi:iron complex transport system permease protein
MAVPAANRLPDASARRRVPADVAALAASLALALALLIAAGLSAGSEGWSFDWAGDAVLIAQIRAPRTIGAALAGALLGLAGAIAQGLFRNPLADPYLLGSAAGAGLGVTLVLAATGLLSTAAGASIGAAAATLAVRVGLVGAAFAGALLGVALTLLLARGAGRPMVLLLAGVVVGVMLGALSDLMISFSPQALRSRQLFLLGTTAFLGWPSVWVMVIVLGIVLPLSVALSRALDALVLGEAGAISLGVNLTRVRLLLVALMALATGAAVAQAGLVAFVGLVAPHLVRRWAVVAHAGLLALASLAGAVLLLAADVAARNLVAPQELPVGVLTAVIGGAFLLGLLWRRTEADR